MSLSTPGELEFDVALVGGGLASSLVAVALGARRPELRVALIERRGRLEVEQQWCAFASDLDLVHPDPARVWALVEPLVAASWDSHEIVFPNHQAHRAGRYLAVDALRLARATEEALDRPGCRLFVGTTARSVEPGRVVLGDGQIVSARFVVDGRGSGPADWRGCAGFQKFVGQEVSLGAGSRWSVTAPILMDASGEQTEGYRFMYVLPLPNGRLLVEDTSFSDDPVLDRGERVAAIERYVRARGAKIDHVVREESGVLPMPWRLPAQPARASGVTTIGYAGGFFHAATGYSLASAALVADAVAGIKTEDGPGALARAIEPIGRRLRSQNRFFRLLNRLSFRAVAPAQRRGLFERFYRLPPALIERFYAAATTLSDRLRLLGGSPPRGLSLARLLAPVEQP